jgi:hypothetical protein
MDETPTLSTKPAASAGDSQVGDRVHIEGEVRETGETGQGVERAHAITISLAY